MEEFSPVSDVYALGATLYFLVHGKRPVSAVNRASGTELIISVQLSQEIKDIINASMQVSKRERAKNVDVFLKEVSFPEQRKDSSVNSVVSDEETIIASDEEDDVPFEILLKRAEDGDAEAQNELGECYYYGEKVEENMDQAVFWFMKAAEQGDADAQYSLGWCYEHGEGVEKDKKKALEWFMKSAEHGNAEAQNDLGWCYDIGEGVEKDEYKAFEWYKKSAEQGLAKAQCNLGWYYYSGEVVEENKQIAFELYKKAAQQGNANALFNIGWFYYKGEVVEKDKNKAFEWFNKAFEQDSTNKSSYKEKERLNSSVKDDHYWIGPKSCLTFVGIFVIILGYMYSVVCFLKPLAYNSAYGLIPLFVIVPIFLVISLYSMLKIFEKKWNWKWVGICIFSMIMGCGVTYLFYKLIG